MKLVKCDRKEIRSNVYWRKTDNMKLIEEFANSSLDCAKVEGWTQKSATGCAGSLNKTIKLLHKNNMKAISQHGEVFLVKTE